MKHLICHAICALIFAGAAAAAPLVRGTVTALNGTPIADVQVQVEISVVRTATASDAHGQFEFDAARLFSPEKLRDAGALMLMFSKPGFQPVNKQVQLVEGQLTLSVKVQLDPTGGSAAIPANAKETLNKYVAAPGTLPLFLIPYTLTGLQAAEPKNLNESLRANLERVIITHLQVSGVSGSQAVSIKLLPEGQANDIDRMRTYGAYLKGLGMISGYGATGDSRSFGVSSTFLVVPQVEAVGAPVLYVDDDVPADSIASPRLYKYLSKLWGRSTVLALGIHEYRQAVTDHDKPALNRVRKYLHAERAGAGPGDEALVSQLNKLIGAVDQELTK